MPSLNRGEWFLNTLGVFPGFTDIFRSLVARLQGMFASLSLCGFEPQQPRTVLSRRARRYGSLSPCNPPGIVSFTHGVFKEIHLVLIFRQPKLGFVYRTCQSNRRFVGLWTVHRQPHMDRESFTSRDIMDFLHLIRCGIMVFLPLIRWGIVYFLPLIRWGVMAFLLSVNSTSRRSRIFIAMLSALLGAPTF